MPPNKGDRDLDSRDESPQANEGIGGAVSTRGGYQSMEAVCNKAIAR